MVVYLSSQPDWAGYQVSTKRGSGPFKVWMVVALATGPTVVAEVLVEE